MKRNFFSKVFYQVRGPQYQGYTPPNLGMGHLSPDRENSQLFFLNPSLCEEPVTFSLQGRKGIQNLRRNSGALSSGHQFCVRVKLYFFRGVGVREDRVSSLQEIPNPSPSRLTIDLTLDRLSYQRLGYVFGCKEAAQQVIMYVCVSESQVEILPSYRIQCNIQYTVPECSRMFQNVPEC